MVRLLLLGLIPKFSFLLCTANVKLPSSKLTVPAKPVPTIVPGKIDVDTDLPTGVTSD